MPDYSTQANFDFNSLCDRCYTILEKNNILRGSEMCDDCWNNYESIMGPWYKRETFTVMLSTRELRIPVTVPKLTKF